MELLLHSYTHLHGIGKGKGKVHPITGHEDPEGEKRYTSTLSLTSVLGWVGVHRRTSAAFPTGKRPGTHYTEGWVGPRADLEGLFLERIKG